jgi:cytidine deaminase
MEIIKKESLIKSYAHITELPEQFVMLLQFAKEAVNTSYAPYSKFHVGCALMLKNGQIIKGSNQENIAYPSGLCAERVAIFYAGAAFPNEAVTHMAITVKARDYVVNEPVLSCGACLQSISEFETKFNQPITMILQGETGNIYVAEGTKTFMPFQFFVKELKG